MKRDQLIKYIVLTCILSGVGLFINSGCNSRKSIGEEPNTEMTYEGDSTELKDTIIVPTLDTDVPKGKNVIWCSSFQIAWNELKDNIVKEPIIVLGAEEAAGRLNDAKQSSEDIAEESYYATAGLIKDGIAEKIRTEMAEKFPPEPPPDFNDITPKTIIIAYSYLLANVKFKIPFFENSEALFFGDSQGEKTAVTSFGIRPEGAASYDKLRKQVEVLYFSQNSDNYSELVEFAVDLCKYTEPYQIVLACVEQKESLGQTLADLNEKLKVFGKKEEGFYHEFEISDVLLVPNMFWKIAHHFTELEHKCLGNAGFENYPIEVAMQIIQFKLDRSGAELKSEAKLCVESAPRQFVFNRPFLLYMKKRGAEYPFFVMWIDNSELLSKSSAQLKVD